MADLPFMPLATDAYMADCSHLSDAEHGRYLLILMAMWRAPGQRLPNDDAWLARKFCRSVEAVAAELRPIIEEFCRCDGNWITQKRLAREYETATKSVKRRSDAAKARWERTRGGESKARENVDSGAVTIGEPPATVSANPLNNNETHTHNADAPTPTPTPTVIREERTLSQPGRASTLPPGWEPSEALLDRARKCRPDIQPARLKLETQGFIARKRSDNAHSHNWDEAFIGWILKTTVTEIRTNGSATQRTSQPQRRGGTSTRAAYLAHFGGLGPQGSDRPSDGEGEPELVGSASLVDPERST